MFNAMMDPELMKLAQEQMSKIPPSDLARMQQQGVLGYVSGSPSNTGCARLVLGGDSSLSSSTGGARPALFHCSSIAAARKFTVFASPRTVQHNTVKLPMVLSPSRFRDAIKVLSNPVLMKLATESMKNMKPEDLKLAAEQLKHSTPEDVVQLSEKMASASPEELASLRARSDAQISYQTNVAEMLKKEGNELHTRGQYHDAASKYLRAKDNLKGIPSAKSSTLRLQCSLNLMSCYLKTRKFEDCIMEGSEVLKNDPKNVKALYRRGQAYKELGKLEAALSDLSKAHQFSPEDETIEGVLRDAKKLLEDGGLGTSKCFIEEIEEEEMRPVLTQNSSSVEHTVTQPVDVGECSQNGVPYEFSPSNSENLRAFKDDPESVRLFQKYVSEADPSSLSAMGLEGMSPDIIRTTTEMISSMKPEELQKMLEVASSLKGNGPTFPSLNSNGMTPELIRMASDKISRMSPEELKKMYEFSSSLNTNSAKAASDASRRPESSSQSSASIGELGTSSSGGLSSISNTVQPPSSVPTSSADLQETMRNSMKDPATRQMFASMMKNISPEMMANMSEQFGMKLSKQDAAKAQQTMTSLSPEDLERMMQWAERAQRGIETMKKTKNWLLGKPGMILAFVMLILAFIFHQMGFIGG